MGAVWAAEETGTGRRCALKLMKDAAGHPEARRRFLHEGRAASAVRHPNVVGILDVLEPEGSPPAIAMELLEGEPLRALLGRARRLPLAELTEIVVPVVSAVGAAHALGIVHRDLKPENIFLVRGAAGELAVKVLDFGIAKLTALDGEAMRSTGITTGAVLGTPMYMAPEQVFAERDLDHRADIWALGIIVYECLSGVCPTAGDNVGQVLKHVVARPFEPLGQLVPELPEEVSRLVARMLARDPSHRPSDLNEVLEIFAPFASAPGIPFGAPAGRSRSAGELTGRGLDRPTVGEATPRRRGWTWHSTLESADAGVVSALAIAETIAASAVCAWIAWRFGTFHLTVSACVAPLLLLRTPRSVSLALRSFHSWFSPEPVSPAEKMSSDEVRPLSYAAAITIVIGISFTIIVVFPFGLLASLRYAGPVITIRVAATAVTAVTRPLESIAEIPRNWWRAIATIDSYYPLEMLPGAYRRYGSDLHDFETDVALMPWKGVRSLLASSRGTDLIVRSIHVSLLSAVAAVFLSLAIFYRWSLKGSALIYGPLVWVAHGATRGSLRDRLQDLHGLFYYRLTRAFAVVVLLLFSAKVYVHHAWSELEPYWRAIPGHELLEATVVPEAFPPWQIAVVVNAALAWGLYCAADWVIARWRRGSPIHEQTIETVLHAVSLVRGVLSVYAIACGIYLAASLSGRFDLPPMGTRILPWL